VVVPAVVVTAAPPSVVDNVNDVDPFVVGITKYVVGLM
jgi:hypothetical protein